MENLAKDVLNAGIGVAQSVKTLVEEQSETIKKSFEELRNKGAANQSETVAKIREQVDTATATISEYTKKIEDVWNENQPKINEAVQNLRETVKFDELKTNVEEASTKVQAAVNENLDKVKAAFEDLKLEELPGKVEELIQNLTNGSASTEEAKTETKEEAKEAATA